MEEYVQGYQQDILNQYGDIYEVSVRKGTQQCQPIDRSLRCSHFLTYTYSLKE